MENNSDLFVKMSLQSWETTNKRVTGLLDQLTDDQLLAEIAPGRNRGIYLLGHLIAVHDMMQPLLGTGERIYPHLEDIFISQPDRAVEELSAVKTLREQWNHISALLTEQFNKMSAADWFQKHTAVSEADFAKEPQRNKLNVLLSRTGHLSYHFGQLILLKK
jgi:DinB superfamily